MPLILKVMHGPAAPGEQPHSLYGDIRSVSFLRQSDGSAWARAYILEPIKTAAVPGFHENQVNIDIPHQAFVMNEAGRTVSSFDGTYSEAHDRRPADSAGGLKSMAA